MFSAHGVQPVDPASGACEPAGHLYEARVSWVILTPRGHPWPAGHVWQIFPSVVRYLPPSEAQVSAGEGCCARVAGANSKARERRSGREARIWFFAGASVFV